MEVSPGDALTDRQLAACRLRVDGASYTRIGEQVGRSPATIAQWFQNAEVLKKLAWYRQLRDQSFGVSVAAANDPVRLLVEHNKVRAVEIIIRKACEDQDPNWAKEVLKLAGYYEQQGQGRVVINLGNDVVKWLVQGMKELAQIEGKGRVLDTDAKVLDAGEPELAASTA